MDKFLEKEKQLIFKNNFDKILAELRFKHVKKKKKKFQEKSLLPKQFEMAPGLKLISENFY